ncbi:MAG: hypothetical protein E7Z94_06760 [Actinomyces ruminicola]|nr:hypothetical protein [Actinomyces ruminicola]
MADIVTRPGHTVVGVVENGRLRPVNTTPPQALDPAAAAQSRQAAHQRILQTLMSSKEEVDINVMEAITGRRRDELDKHNPDYPRGHARFKDLPVEWRKTAADRIRDALWHLQEDYDRNVQLNLRWVAWQLDDTNRLTRMDWVEEKKKRLEAEAREKAEREAAAAAEAALTSEQRRQRAIDQILDTRLLDPQSRQRAGRGEIIGQREVREGSTIYQELIYAAPLPDRAVMAGAVARQAARLSGLEALSVPMVCALTGFDTEEVHAWQDMTGTPLNWGTLPAEWTGDWFRVQVTRAIHALKTAAEADPEAVDPWAATLRDVLLALGYDPNTDTDDDTTDDDTTDAEAEQQEEPERKRHRWPWQH